MKFFEPQGLLLLFLVPVVGIFWRLAIRRRKKLVEKFIEAELIEKVGFIHPRRTLKVFLMLLGIVFLALALADPRWGEGMREVKRRGVDIVVALDTSNSMLATDVYPTRLEKAKLKIRQLVSKMQGDRVGLVVFAGSSFIICPLTIDYGVFDFQLGDMDTETISQQGTDLEGAIRTAVGTFDTEGDSEKVIILFTDGEKQWGDPVRASREAAEKGVRIYAIGIGSAKGSEIIVTDERTGEPKKVVSKLDYDVLKEVAYVTDGLAKVSTITSEDVDVIYGDHIARLEKADIESRLEQRSIMRFQIPLFLAILLIVAQGFIKE